jgi:hypothetical protein
MLLAVSEMLPSGERRLLFQLVLLLIFQASSASIR